jgi:hypothetical protein
MNKEKLKELIFDNYPETPDLAIKNFIDYIKIDLGATPDKWSKILKKIVKYDNRDSYRKMLPSFDFYNNIDYGELFEINNISYLQSQQYAIESWKDKSIEEIISKVSEIREDRENIFEKLRKSKNYLKKNQMISFLCVWDKLSTEKFFAEEAGMAKDQIDKYLKHVKDCIIKGVKYDRPYLNDRKRNENTKDRVTGGKPEKFDNISKNIFK